ncbi:MAG: T9SS type A sorting domain-containing protein, partial [Chitinophagales bacterium]
ISGIETPASVFSIQIFPQPAHDYFCVKGIQSPMSLQIYDVSGSFTCEFYAGQNSMINISSLKSGIYLIHVMGVSSIGWLKLVVQ